MWVGLLLLFAKVCIISLRCVAKISVKEHIFLSDHPQHSGEGGSAVSPRRGDVVVKTQGVA